MSTSNTFIWANLVHLGRNMCSDVPVKSFGKTPPELLSYICYEEAFLRRMPKSVLQSNWYYGKTFDPQKQNYVKAYLTLEKAGFDQIPTASNWSVDESFGMTVDYCREHIAPERLKGFLQTPWKETVEPFRANIEQAIDPAGDVIRRSAR